MKKLTRLSIIVSLLLAGCGSQVPKNDASPSDQAKIERDGPAPGTCYGALAACKAAAKNDWAKCRADAIARGGNATQCDNIRDMEINECEENHFNCTH